MRTELSQNDSQQLKEQQYTGIIKNFIKQKGYNNSAFNIFIENFPLEKEYAINIFNKIFKTAVEGTCVFQDTEESEFLITTHDVSADTYVKTFIDKYGCDYDKFEEILNSSNLSEILKSERKNYFKSLLCTKLDIKNEINELILTRRKKRKYDEIKLSIFESNFADSEIDKFIQNNDMKNITEQTILFDNLLDRLYYISTPPNVISYIKQSILRNLKTVKVNGASSYSGYQPLYKTYGDLLKNDWDDKTIFNFGDLYEDNELPENNDELFENDLFENEDEYNIIYDNPCHCMTDIFTRLLIRVGILIKN